MSKGRKALSASATAERPGALPSAHAVAEETPLDWAAYKACVEAAQRTDERGFWQLHVSDMAKAPGDWFLEYHYSVMQTAPDGKQYYHSVMGPYKVMSLDENPFDRRYQLSEEELLAIVDDVRGRAR